METSVQLPPPVLLPRARIERTLFRPEIQVERDEERGLIKPAGRKARPLRAVWLGLVVMLAQLFVAVVLLAPEGPLWYRYSTLVQHDSYWFANIIDRGYDTILPPINRKMMEVSNVAFFPAYPAIAGALHHWFGLSTYNALLDHGAGGGVGVLELFLPLLRTLESVAAAASSLARSRSSRIRRRFFSSPATPSRCS